MKLPELHNWSVYSRSPTDNRERIRQALQFIPVGGHDERVRIAYMLQDGFGDQGRDLWDEWRGDRGDDEANAVWKSASKPGDLKLGTLIWEAKRNGWPDDGTYQAPSPQELAERERARQDRQAKADAENAAQREQAARWASAILKAESPAGADHPYLVRKQVAPTATLKEIDIKRAVEILNYHPSTKAGPLAGRLLVVPVKQGEKVSTLELIDEAGRKTGLPGHGTRASGFWATERLPGDDGSGHTIVIGEGVATVLSASQAVACLGVAALSSSNLPAVAGIMRERYPEAEIIVLADLVKATGEPDPGAVKAAQETGCKLAVPDFGPGREPSQTDFNDLAVSLGTEAVVVAIRDAQGFGPSIEDRPAPVDVLPSVTLIRGSDLNPEPIEWIWNGYLAAGKMHILGGAPGTGKTTIAMGLAATVTVGGRWPDGTVATAGNVVIWSGEDDPKDTLLPRLVLSGADPSRVFFIGDVIDGGLKRTFDPARDLGPLRRTMDRIGWARLLIVDPIVSVIVGDSHKNAEVRRALQPLVELAGTMRCALLGITHFSKGTGGREPVERITGSLAFGALARVVMVAAKHQEESTDGRAKRLFCRAKSNIGPDDGGFEYDLHQAELPAHPGVFASAVLWGNSVEGAARDLLATADATGDDGEGGALAEAKQYLLDLLADGPIPAKTIEADAREAGHSPRTIRRAKGELGIKAEKEGGRFGNVKPKWIWRLPNSEDIQKVAKKSEDYQQKRVDAFSKIGHLQEKSGYSPNLASGEHGEDSGMVEVEI